MNSKISVVSRCVRACRGMFAVSTFLCLASSTAIAGAERFVWPNGVDDTANIQFALDVGFVVSLQPGATYYISRRLDVTRNNSGILTYGTPAKLIMTTAFNNVDPHTMFSPSVRSDSIGIRAENVTGLVLQNFKMEKVHLDGTYVSGIWLRGVTRANLKDLELWGFSLGPIIAIDSVSDVTIRGCIIRDSWAGSISTNPAFLKFPQLTGLLVDDNKLNNETGAAIGSTRVIIANNTFKKLRFKRSLYEMPRNLFPGMEQRTGGVGYQTDGITVAMLANHLTIMGNVIDVAGEGIDAMGEHIRIEENLVTNTFDFAVKFVHGGSHNVARRNTLTAAGIANMYVAGSSATNVGNTFGNLFTENAISKVGNRAMYCGASAEAGFKIDPCPTGAIAAAAYVQINGGVQVPYYNLFHGNTITVSSSDTRMGYLFRTDASTHYSLFYGNVCTGPCPASDINPNSIGSVVDPAANRLVVGDMDNNGIDDFFVSWSVSGKNLLYRKNTDRTVTTLPDLISRTAINGSPDLVRSGDFDGDGHTDLLFYWKQPGTNRFFYGNSVGRFTQVLDPIATTAINGSPDTVLTGDFDGDGHTDLLFYWKQPGTNRFFYGDGLGSFTQVLDPIATTAINGSPDVTLTGDFDGDRRTDLLFHWKTTGDNRFYFGTGRGSFAYHGNLISPSSVTNSDRVFSFDADFNGRDDVDFFWYGARAQRLYVGASSRQFLRD